jgi:hypothetical protein
MELESRVLRWGGIEIQIDVAGRNLILIEKLFRSGSPRFRFDIIQTTIKWWVRRWVSKCVVDGWVGS